MEQVSDTQAYEIEPWFIQKKDWSNYSCNVENIIKETEKAVYVTIVNNMNGTSFDTWVPKSVLIPVTREAKNGTVRKIRSKTCEYIVYGRKRMGYSDFESAKKYIQKLYKEDGYKVTEAFYDNVHRQWRINLGLYQHYDITYSMDSELFMWKYEECLFRYGTCKVLRVENRE